VSAPPLPPSKVLVVDDNPATLYATSRILRNAGFDVTTAETGTTAVQVATTELVDLIVLDINLPDLDGFEVLRRVRANPGSSTVRVVYLSASFVDDVHRVEGYEAGADAFLTHPVEPMVLVATIKALLRTRAVELQLAELLQRERSVREEAEQANRAKDEFLATLSHEVLNALKVILRNARFQTQLITDLLDVSRITLGKLELAKETLALGDIIHAAVESMRAVADDAGIRIEADLSDDLGLLHADSVRLQQVITNLLRTQSSSRREAQPFGCQRAERGNAPRFRWLTRDVGSSRRSCPICSTGSGRQTLRHDAFTVALVWDWRS
jgi:DNA-binding response OmpR family regulator